MRAEWWGVARAVSSIISAASCNGGMSACTVACFTVIDVTVMLCNTVQLNHFSKNCCITFADAVSDRNVCSACFQHWPLLSSFSSTWRSDDAQNENDNVMITEFCSLRTTCLEWSAITLCVSSTTLGQFQSRLKTTLFRLAYATWLEAFVTVEAIRIAHYTYLLNLPQQSPARYCFWSHVFVSKIIGKLLKPSWWNYQNISVTVLGSCH